MDTLHQVVIEHLRDIAVPDILNSIDSTINYTWLWAFLDLKGKERYGLKFRLHSADVATIVILLAWYLKDETAAKQLNIRLNAGLLLSGPVGCGKTTLVKLCATIPGSKERPWVKSCREISYEVEVDGPSTILHYTRHSFDYDRDKPKTYIFDDLGLEYNVNHYGNQMSPMKDILLGRYDYFISHGLQTIITTNLTSEQIEYRYGTSVRSRLREMMNLLSFAEDAGDKR
ncbi:MAG: ATPase [Bacteroidota bacterium]